MTAEKFLSDEYLTNHDYALVGGIPVEELNRIERELLNMIDFDLTIEGENIENYKRKLLSFSCSNNKHNNTMNAKTNVEQTNERVNKTKDIRHSSNVCCSFTVNQLNIFGKAC